MNDVKFYDIQSIYLETPSGHFDNIIALNMSWAVGSLPNCIVSLSTGGKYSDTAETQTIEKPSFPALDEECSLYIKINNVSYLLMSGFIAGEQASVSAIQDNISSRRSYRIASITERLDSIPPMAVRYISNAVGGSQQAQRSFILVTDAIATAKKLISRISANYKDIGDLIIKCLTEVQTNISFGQASPFSNFIKYDTIQLQLKNPPTHLATYMVQHIARSIMNGSSYYNTLLSLCRDLHLNVIPRMTESSSAMVITHSNPWCTPTDIITTDKYSSIELINMSRQSTNVDGVIVSHNGDTTSPAIHRYTLYGQVNGSAGQIQTITKDTLKDVAKTSSFKVAEKQLPGWLVDVSTDNKDTIIRLCKEFFAQESLQGQQLIMTVPLPNFFDFQNNLGVTYEIETVNKYETDIRSRADMHKLFAYLRGINLNILLNAKQINAHTTLTFSHVRTPETQTSLKLDNSELLYNVNTTSLNVVTATPKPYVGNDQAYENY